MTTFCPTSTLFGIHLIFVSKNKVRQNYIIMPNWCTNTLTIKSTDEKFLEDIKDAVDEEKLLEYMVPPPDTDDYKGEGWYHWNIDNWGTKWDICDPQDGGKDWFEDGQYECSFNTAWCPPLEAIEKFSNKMPDDCEVILTYYEGGMCFCGVFAIKGKESFEYSLQNDKFNIKNMEDTSKHDNPYVSEYLYDHIKPEIEYLEELEDE
jgi:hypothetical protein